MSGEGPQERNQNPHERQMTESFGQNYACTGALQPLARPAQALSATPDKWQALMEHAQCCAWQVEQDGLAKGLHHRFLQQIEEAMELGPEGRFEVSDVSPIVAQRTLPEIVLCMPDFGRTWQLKQTLPINLAVLWPKRHFVTVVLADLNVGPSAEMESLLEICAPALEVGLLRHFKRSSPYGDGFDHWHASIGKNCGMSIGSRLCPEGILCEVDCDNFVSQDFIWDMVENGQEMLEGEIAGLCWKHVDQPACTGRTAAVVAGLVVVVACPRAWWKVFIRVSGFWWRSVFPLASLVACPLV